MTPPRSTKSAASRSSKTFEGLGLYYGADQYRLRLAVHASLDRLLGPSERDFNYDRVSAKGLLPPQALSLVGTPPMMGDRRVVQIEDAETLSSETSKALLEWAQSARDRQEKETVLLMVYAEKAPLKAWTELAGVVKSFSEPDQKEALRWVREYAKRKHGVEIPSNLAGRLIERTGILDSGKLAAEVDKLLTLSSGRSLTVEDIDSATELHVQESVFTFYDALGERRFTAARDSLGRLLVMPENAPIPLAAGIATHLLSLGLAAALREEGLSRSQIVPKLANSSYYGGKLAAQSEHWTRTQLDDALIALKEADLALKTGGDGLRTLETFLARTLLLDSK